MIFLYPSTCDELICINTDDDYVEKIQLKPGIDFDIITKEYYRRNFDKAKYILESSYNEINLTTLLKHIINEG